jgi:hypothetical protein
MHGGTDEVQRDVPLYIFSDQISCGRFEEEYISQLDIAPLLCRLLGVSVPGTMKQQIDIAFKQSE